MDERPPAADTLLLAGRYALSSVIGSGGMAEVYRADDVKLSRPVAVKLLRETAGDESDRDRFIDEARTLAMLSHSGLVMVLDAGFGTSREGGSEPAAERPFLVMELVEGSTVAQRLSEGPVPLDEVGAIGAQVAEALAYVHGRGVIHRDIKPGNVLIGARQVKLADFGIARLVAQTTRHTRTGHAIGTAAYLAPEQVRGEQVDGAADVYSLGLVLLEAVTGRREYTGPATEAALARLHRDPDVPAELPPAWRDLLVAMTASDPGHRPTAFEVAATLRAGLAGPAPTGTVGVPDATTAPILQAPGGGPEEAPGETRPLTNPPVPAPLGPRPTEPPAGWAPERPGQGAPATPPRERAQALLERVRAVPPHVRGVAAAVAALVVLLVVVAMASGGGAASDLPDGTPSELRGPLEELREAVEGEDG